MGDLDILSMGCAGGHTRLLQLTPHVRGCGRSKGRTSWTGIPERGDYQAVIDHLLEASKYPKPSHLIISVSSWWMGEE